MVDSKLINYIRDIYTKEEFIINPTCYFYDLNIIKNNISKLEKYSPEQVNLYYAMKANNHVDIMRCITNEKFVKGIEIASSGELYKASKYVGYNNIIFTGPGKTYHELYLAVKNKIRFINVESIVEAIRINNIAKDLNIKNVDVLVRINLNYSVEGAYEKMSGCSTKMGIDEDVCIDAIRKINELDRVTVKGIHVFAASGVINYKTLIKSQIYIFDLVKKLDKEIGFVDVIDFGGGIGIDYTNNNCEFDIEKYCLELKKIIKKYNFYDKEIIMELGTYLVGNAGYYTAKIIDIKEIKGKKHMILAGGVNHIGLPLEMRRKHPVFVVSMNEEKLYDEQPSINGDVVDISGPLCMVSDKICWDEYIDKAEIGDILVVRQSGAYCYAEGMLDFLSHPYPEQIIINND